MRTRMGNALDAVTWISNIGGMMDEDFHNWAMNKNIVLGSAVYYTAKQAWLEAMRRADKRNVDRINQLEAALTEIALYAHDNSTGPAVRDHLWEIRRIAYDAL